MTNFKSPEALAKSMYAYVICVNIIVGAGIWEWATSLDFDLLYLRRKKGLSLAATSYFLIRYLGLALWVVGAPVANAHTPLNCKAWNYAIHVLAYGTAAFTSLLLLLRVSAVSSRNVYIMSFLWASYAAAGVTVVLGMCLANSVYVPEYHACAVTNIRYYRINTIMAAVFDGTCLITMMYFLLRNPRKIIGGSIWELMLRQGATYVLCISLVYIPIIVFLYVDLNNSISQIVNSFAFFAMYVSATRMHRALVVFYETPLGHNSPVSQPATDESIVFAAPAARARRRNVVSMAVTIDELGETTTEEDCDVMGKLETGTHTASVAPATIADLYASDLR
ncbi:hypothetical protein AURDEDRAFT_156474 [Auricularia subglabra TFB-10046 SS5]|nr:hypothetical protein AURDEDRAFT_156474 [Auricularia subglabra TFB-10046 SS5]